MRLIRPDSPAFAVVSAGLLLFVAAGCKDKKERRQVGEPTAGSSAEVSPPPSSELPMASVPVVPTGPSGTIRGVVKFTGEAPEMPWLRNGSDPVCAKKKMRAETIMVNSNQTLQNALVRIKPGTIEPMVPSDPVVVRQLDCMYRPRVQGAVVGQGLIVHNRDETAHNVHVRAAEIGDRQGAEALWNRQQPKLSAGIAPIQSKVEDHPVIRLKCDMHGWMSGYLVVSDNPYSVVTGDDGSFALAVPAGDHTIEVWHEFYGLKEAVVTVADGETATLDFAFDAATDDPFAAQKKAPPTKETPGKTAKGS